MLDTIPGEMTAIASPAVNGASRWIWKVPIAPRSVTKCCVNGRITLAYSPMPFVKAQSRDDSVLL
jgi:hypothetical protein